jgi:hypothetical protein
VAESNGKWLALSQDMRRAVLALALVLGATPVAAQQDHAAHQHEPASTPGWSANLDANVFFGLNLQRRRFASYDGWESQNWLMGGAERPAGPGRLIFSGMLSFEPFTMAPEGSPQLFQTGESYNGVPLANLQHPHDLWMNLGATYIWKPAAVTYTVGADLVGTPTLGPPPFMHRPSARNNPQVPLTHHFLDSTHIAAGVVRGGVTFGEFTIEASGFRGEEPDEDRLDIEAPRIDSWAVRGRWTRGPWELQFSGGHLKQPEWWEPYDLTRYTASLSYDGAVWSRPLTAILAWGGNRQFNGFNGDSDGFLLEWNLDASPASAFFGRTEQMSKELFGMGPHEKGFAHPHWFHEIWATTFGYLHDLPFIPIGRLGLGGDFTFYAMQPDLALIYEGSHSFHFFLRWRPKGPAAHHH